MGPAGKTVVRILVFVLLVGLGVLIMNIPRLVGPRRAGRGSPFAPLNDSGVVPPDSFPLDSARVMAGLARVIDPELGLSIVELGLVHSVTVDSGGNVSVVLSLTTPGCPFAGLLGQQALEAVRQIPGARGIQVRLDPLIPWDPSRVSDRARKKYESLFRVTP